MITIKQVPVEDIYLLRRDELRQGRPIETVHFQGDFDEGAMHFALFVDGALVGCATLIKSMNDRFEQELQYQLRGMAVDSQHQRQGLGTALLKYAEYLVLQEGASRLWCNARVSAQGFYEKNGFVTFGETFFIPDVCDHIVMSKLAVYGGCCGCNGKSKDGK